MKNWKILVALLLSLFMVISLVACSDSGRDRDDEEETEETKDNGEADQYAGMTAKELYKLCKEMGIDAEQKQSVDYYIDLLLEAEENEDWDDEDWDDEDWDEEPANTNNAVVRPHPDAEVDKDEDKDEETETLRETGIEESPVEDDRDDDPEDLIVGEWRAEIDVTDLMIESFITGLGDEDAADCFDFDDMSMYITFEFTKKGKIAISMDYEECVDVLVEGVKDGLEDYADYLGVDVEDLLDELGTDEDGFGDALVETMGLDSMSFESESEYEIDGDEIVVEGDGLEFEFDGEDTLIVDAEALGLAEMIGEDTIEFERQ